MKANDEAPLEVVVLRGVDGFMAAVLMNGEWVGFYPGETRTAAAAQAVLAVTESLPTWPRAQRTVTRLRSVVVLPPPSVTRSTIVTFGCFFTRLRSPFDTTSPG